MSNNYFIEPIGIIRSPVKSRSDAPKQGSESNVEGSLVVQEKYADAFLGLSPGQKILILYWLHLAQRDCLQVHPRGDQSRPIRGVFSTRSPDRPNPIGVELVEILKIEGNTITVRGLDALDGTPLIDIKCDV